MRLLGVELHRFSARRAVALMMLGIILLVGWMTVDTVWSSRPVSDAEVAAAKEQAAQELDFYQEEYNRCIEDPESWGGEGMTAADCPPPEADYRWYLTRSPLDLAQETQDTGKAAIVLLAGIAIIIGATFAGADWSTGSMGNQLIFRPRRLQVWTAKGVAVAFGVTVVGALVLSAQWGVYFATAAARDIGHSPGFVGDLLEINLRGLALIAGGGVGGYALSMLLRSTVGTLALLFFYSVGGEALVAMLPFEKDSRWSLANNVFAWLDNGVNVYDESIDCANAMDCSQNYLLSLSHGATYLGTLLSLVVVLSAVSFRRRDVP